MTCCLVPWVRSSGALVCLACDRAVISSDSPDALCVRASLRAVSDALEHANEVQRAAGLAPAPPSADTVEIPPVRVVRAAAHAPHPRPPEVSAEEWAGWRADRGEGASE